MTKETAQQIATTIFEQLGGNRFKLMTGARQVSFESDGSLTVKLPCNGVRGFALRIALNASDLYDMEFITIKRNWEITKKTINDVYCDQLQSVFTAETGLYTSL